MMRAPTAERPGRSCPADYRCSPAALARDVELHADTLYVVGGLYGNVPALETILEMAHADANAAVVFNGDFNWFNVDAGAFAAVNEAVLNGIALRGNVETEIARDDDAAGRGCAYPDDVADADVQRSNAIIARLRDFARRAPDVRARLGSLPMQLVAEVGGLRVGIVHGDADSLAGWSYSERALSHGAAVAQVARDLEIAALRVIASTHTCLPVAVRVDTALGAGALFNNGSVRMPNFRNTRYGVITRIAIRPASNALYGTRIGDTFVDAVAVDYDRRRWLQTFLASWPEGSAAYRSCFSRIADGPSYRLSQAARDGIAVAGWHGVTQ